MGHIFAIGDVHGCLRPLEDLLSKLPVDWKQDQLVFLGDYIDRGPDPRLVLETVMALKEEYPQNVICLMGNHEWMLLRYLKGKDQDMYLLNGGDVTLAQFWRDGIVDIPPDYVTFLQSLLPYWETDRYIFVHAGLRPGIPVTAQKLEDLLFIRGEFIHTDYDWGKRVIFAHTPFPEPLVTPQKIGIDTGCVYGGRLTAVQLPEVIFYASACGR